MTPLGTRENLKLLRNTMNVACPKCSAKYALPDAKVQGRKVRITCKRCGAPIIADGRHLGAPLGSAAADAGSAKASTKPPPASPAAATTATPAVTAKPAVATRPTTSARPVTTTPATGAPAAAKPAAPAPAATAKPAVTTKPTPATSTTTSSASATRAPAPLDASAAPPGTGGVVSDVRAGLVGQASAKLGASGLARGAQAAGAQRSPIASPGLKTGLSPKPPVVTGPAASKGLGAGLGSKPVAAPAGASFKSAGLSPKPPAAAPGAPPRAPLAGGAPALSKTPTPTTAVRAAIQRPGNKSTLLGGLTAPQAALPHGAAPKITPQAAAPKAATTPTPAEAPSPAAPAAAAGLTAKPRPIQRTLLGTGALGGPEVAKPLQTQTLLGGLSPALGAAPAPESPAAKPPGAGQPGAPAIAPSRPWTVAVTDEDHYEMNTTEVVQAFHQGNISDETFIWKEGMDDWLTPFEIPEIAAELRRRGLRPSGGAAPHEAPKPGASFEDATEVRPSPFGEASLGAPSPQPPAAATAPPAQPTPAEPVTRGVWQEPGDWKRGEPQPDDVTFDDVTVAMAAPQSKKLLEDAARLSLVSAHSEPDPAASNAPTVPPPPPEEIPVSIEPEPPSSELEPDASLASPKAVTKTTMLGIAPPPPPRREPSLSTPDVDPAELAASAPPAPAFTPTPPPPQAVFVSSPDAPLTQAPLTSDPLLTPPVSIPDEEPAPKGGRLGLWLLVILVLLLAAGAGAAYAAKLGPFAAAASPPGWLER
ncbi:MAG: zinc-ribbon domain-containing protein [Polyangiaceae bacterium]|nr:zinc-ribbon domain-containing protein [Polyangiaceae bacterium]MCW5790948.1 zinc-ribbon domain-containing protein [Polyangiaceae bacterium]